MFPGRQLPFDRHCVRPPDHLGQSLTGPSLNVLRPTVVTPEKHELVRRSGRHALAATAIATPRATA
jgi:hypothetical protein